MENLIIENNDNQMILTLNKNGFNDDFLKGLVKRKVLPKRLNFRAMFWV